MTGRLLLVIPPVVRMVNGIHEVEADFANNLKSYLANFSHVTFACPVLLTEKDSGILRSIPLSKIQNNDRLSYLPLPYAYREDRYLRHYLATRRLLRSEIAKADYLLFSPHAKYDWPTLAALQAMRMKRKYDMESDWDHGNVARLHLTGIPPGFNKIRKTVWMYSFLRTVNKCFSHSALALLQGQDVFDAYKDVAPNPKKVLNVQVSSVDHIPTESARRKTRARKKDKPLTISYAGRMIEMKGPFDWLRAIRGAVDAGVELRATWFGDGSLMSEMQHEAKQLGIHNRVAFAGIVDRDEIMASLQKTDIFLFCHKTGESPRCLGEALAAGCPLVGYGTAYSRDLVATRGGGAFAAVGDYHALAEYYYIPRPRSIEARRPD